MYFFLLSSRFIYSNMQKKTSLESIPAFIQRLRSKDYGFDVNLCYVVRSYLRKRFIFLKNFLKEEK